MTLTITVIIELLSGSATGYKENEVMYGGGSTN